MIENIDASTIGVATRWFLGPGHMYQNSVHSTIQFFSSYVWKLFYQRKLNSEKGINSYKTTSVNASLDERLNFGKAGSVLAYEPRIFPESAYTFKTEN